MAARDISFGSFNLYNLQSSGEAIYRDTDGWSVDVYKRKVEWSGRVLKRLTADVVGFQELWAEEALTDVLKEADLQSSHLPLVPPDHRDDRIVCAGAVRKDILVGEPEWLISFPEEMVLKSSGDDPQTEFIAVELNSFSRPVLHFKVQIAAGTPVIHVFVCHFKSRRPTEIWRERSWYRKSVHGPHVTALGYAISTIRRTAEAAALRVSITEITKGTSAPVVVIGDMNDGENSNTLNILTEQPNYLTALSTGGGDNSLYTAQTLQGFRSVRDVYYTNVFKKQRESLDHILFTEEFYDNSRKRLWAFDEMTVENDHLNFDDHQESGTSDHGVVRAAFRWRPAPGATS